MEFDDEHLKNEHFNLSELNSSETFNLEDLNEKITDLNQNYSTDELLENIDELQENKISIYLVNELDKKNNYITELEEIIKIQQNEINILKKKIESIDKIDILLKLKNSMDEKSTELQSIMKNECIIEQSLNDKINSEINFKNNEKKIITEHVDEESEEKVNEIIKIRRRAMKKF